MSTIEDIYEDDINFPIAHHPQSALRKLVEVNFNVYADTTEWVKYIKLYLNNYYI